jgi:5-hydroxyisourate hydrolase-like protein (transthyretin family)
MSAISTHVLDAVLGKPAAGIAIRLEKHDKQSAASLGDNR